MAKAKAETKKAGAKPSAKKSGGQPEPIDKKKELQALQAKLNGEYKGRATIKTADEFDNVFILRRPTGITSLDIRTGGGFPAGGMTQIVGRQSVGKDYICNRIISNIQRIYGEDASIALAMTEMSFDKKYAKDCGARIAYTKSEIKRWEQALGRPFTDEEMKWATDQVGNVQQIMASTAEELLDMTAQVIESNLYQVVIINSFGALLTKAEEESEVGDKHYGGATVAITQFMHKVHRALNLGDAYGRPNTTTIIGINQFRQNMGGDAKFNPLNISGGYALKHGKLVDIYLEDRARITIPGQKANKKIVVGKEIHWKILKGKAGCHDGPEGTYPFYFGEHGYPFGADLYSDLIRTMGEYGLIQQAGPWLSFEDGEVSLKAQGAERMALAIYEQGVFEYLRDKCFQAADVKFITKEDE